MRLRSRVVAAILFIPLSFRLFRAFFFGLEFCIGRGPCGLNLTLALSLNSAVTLAEVMNFDEEQIK